MKKTHYCFSEKNKAHKITDFTLPKLREIPSHFIKWIALCGDLVLSEHKIPQIYTTIKAIINGCVFFISSSHIAKIVIDYLRAKHGRDNVFVWYTLRTRYMKDFLVYFSDPAYGTEKLRRYVWSRPIVQIAKHTCYHPVVKHLCAQHGLPLELELYIYKFLK